LLLLCAARANAQLSSVTLELKAGRPFRVALDQKVAIKRVGQPVTGTIVEAVWAYDRIVIPAGTRVRGHIIRIDSGSRVARTRAYLGGDLSPPRLAIVQFETLVFDGGREITMETVVKGGVPNVERQVAGGAGVQQTSADTAGDESHESIASHAKNEVRQRTKDAISSAKQRATDALAAVKGPGKMERVKDEVVARLPYHPQYLTKGLVYDVELTSPLDFGSVEPSPPAAEGALPAPDSILTARLATSLDSSKTPRVARSRAYRTGILGRSRTDSSRRDDDLRRSHVRARGPAIPSQRPAAFPVRARADARRAVGRSSGEPALGAGKRRRPPRPR
jgi:hypothetical protein